MLTASPDTRRQRATGRAKIRIGAEPAIAISVASRLVKNTRVVRCKTPPLENEPPASPLRTSAFFPSRLCKVPKNFRRPLTTDRAMALERSDGSGYASAGMITCAQPTASFEYTFLRERFIGALGEILTLPRSLRDRSHPFKVLDMSSNDAEDDYPCPAVIFIAALGGRRG